GSNNRHVVPWNGNSRGHREPAFRYRNDTTGRRSAGFIDGGLQFGRDVARALDENDLAARIAADRLFSQPVSHIRKIVEPPLASAKVDRMNCEFAVTLGEQLRVPGLCACAGYAQRKQSRDRFFEHLLLRLPARRGVTSTARQSCGRNKSEPWTPRKRI